jgi:hypothetical protein
MDTKHRRVTQRHFETVLVCMQPAAANGVCAINRRNHLLVLCASLIYVVICLGATIDNKRFPW